MAINKTKSFSPYSYGLRYLRAGANPNIGPVQHLKSAPLQEPQYVISRVNPSFYAFAVSTMYYSSNDSCELQLERAVTTVSVVGKDSSQLEITEPTLVNVSRIEKCIEVDLKDTPRERVTSPRSGVSCRR